MPIPSALHLKWLFLWLCLPFTGVAARLHGRVTDGSGKPIPFASVTLRGTTIGTTSNTTGEYILEVPAGNHVVECRHVGYRKESKALRMDGRDQRLDFVLRIEELTMSAIVVKPGGEDPANAIIREAIRARPRFERQVEGYSCDVYVKGLIRLDSFPDKFMGQKVDLEDGDTGKQRIIFLSETLARLSVKPPDKQTVHVRSTRVSGSSDSYGLADPRVISFYTNNVEISRTLNPRGYVSPIADNAFQYYRFRYRGAFFEDGRQIARIEVIPRRAFDPAFSGFIQIVDDEWSIHSLELSIGKDAQLTLLDKLVIRQQHMPLPGKVWMLQNQSIIPSVRKFGFQVGGYFSAVFSNYEIDPAFDKRSFGRVILRYDSGSNQRTRQWWDSIRPMPLQPEELRDFKRKDSLEQLRKQPAYLDSLDSIRNRVTAMSLFLTGQSFIRRSKKLSLSIDPLIKYIGFNTVEGGVLRLNGTLERELTSRRSLSISPSIRYGFGNGHLNPSLTASLRNGGKSEGRWTLAGGSGVFQFNGANPISQLANTNNTLFFGNNHMKIYEARFLNLTHARNLGPGLTLTASLRFQDRLPLENTDSSTFWGRRSVTPRFTPNRATGWSPYNIERHQATLLNVTLRYRPGVRYVEFPDRREELSSRYPLITLDYVRGVHGLFGGDVDFDRWKLSLTDYINLGMAGRLGYRVSAGGFGFARKVELPDLQHFNGNQLFTAQTYLNTFQLAPYYTLSQAGGRYALMHIQHELLGGVTNRIPLVQRLDVRLLWGANILYRSPSDHYLEAFAGIDNILNTMRVDWVRSWYADRPGTTGIRIGVRILNELLSDN